jgi:hypothetical protein
MSFYFQMSTTSIHSFSQPLIIEKSSSISETIRNLISNAFAPFQKEYRRWPWSQIGTIVIVCIGSYALYKYLPGPYRRYYMSSTKNFSQRYNEALHLEKEALFNELKNVKTREEGRKIQVVEIGAAHGANMAYYPPHGKNVFNNFFFVLISFMIAVEIICVEPIREFEVYLTQTLRQNPHVKCRELLVGNAENISGK